jgi:hypothetical protein
MTAPKQMMSLLQEYIILRRTLYCHKNASFDDLSESIGNYFL